MLTAVRFLIMAVVVVVGVWLGAWMLASLSVVGS